MTIDELLQTMGRAFAKRFAVDRREAWRQLVETMMSNLDILTSAKRAQELRDILGIAMQIDQQLAGGKEAGKASTRLGMDAISRNWVRDNTNVLNES